jgi:hypothetical protein
MSVGADHLSVPVTGPEPASGADGRNRRQHQDSYEDGSDGLAPRPVRAFRHGKALRTTRGGWTGRHAPAPDVPCLIGVHGPGWTKSGHSD